VQRRAVSLQQRSLSRHVIVVWRFDRLIMNNDLDKGSQIPYIERAMKEGFEVVVLNTNLNKCPDVPRNGGINVEDVPVTLATVISPWHK